MANTETDRGFEYSSTEVMDLLNPIITQYIGITSNPETIKSFLSAKDKNPDIILSTIYVMGGSVLKGIPASELQEIATKTQFSPLGELKHSEAFIAYLRGRAEALKEAPNLKATEIMSLAK